MSFEFFNKMWNKMHEVYGEKIKIKMTLDDKLVIYKNFKENLPTHISYVMCWLLIHYHFTQNVEIYQKSLDIFNNDKTVKIYPENIIDKKANRIGWLMVMLDSLSDIELRLINTYYEECIKAGSNSNGNSNDE